MQGIDLETVGQRIVQMAHLAVAMHLHESVATSDRSVPRQRVEIGGAGPRLVDATIDSRGSYTVMDD